MDESIQLKNPKGHINQEDEGDYDTPLNTDLNDKLLKEILFRKMLKILNGKSKM